MLGHNPPALALPARGRKKAIFAGWERKRGPPAIEDLKKPERNLKINLFHEAIYVQKEQNSE